MHPENGIVNMARYSLLPSGLVKSENDAFDGWYYVRNGCVQKGQETVVQNSSGWWYIGTDGKVDFHKNTVAPNEYGWWAV